MRARIKKALVEAIRIAETRLPVDVLKSIEQARATETSVLGRIQLDTILKNITVSAEKSLPMCQDTGLLTYYVDAGVGSPYLSDVLDVLKDATAFATESVPLRPNTVDPFNDRNPGDNSGLHMPVIDIMPVDGDDITIHIMPKGGGSESWCALWMLTPSEGITGARNRILEHLKKAGGMPCPPVVLGIGIGGTSDFAMRLAKRSLLRPLGQHHPEPHIASIEETILTSANELGIGPMGLGGSTTVLDVHIEYTYRHPASYPVALAMQCWADRRAHVVVSGNETVKVIG